MRGGTVLDGAFVAGPNEGAESTIGTTADVGAGGWLILVTMDSVFEKPTPSEEFFVIVVPLVDVDPFRGEPEVGNGSTSFFEDMLSPVFDNESSTANVEVVEPCATPRGGTTIVVEPTMFTLSSSTCVSFCLSFLSASLPGCSAKSDSSTGSSIRSNDAFRSSNADFPANWERIGINAESTTGSCPPLPSRRTGDEPIPGDGGRGTLAGCSVSIEFFIAV